MKIHFHEGDLPAGVDFGKSVAIDTETLGLNPQRDALCLAQLSGGDGHCHIVRFDRKSYAAPNLVRLLIDPDVVKIFHYARLTSACSKTPENESDAHLVHQDRVKACTDLHRPAWPEGSSKGAFGRRFVEAAAEFGLGRGEAQ